MVRKSFLVPLIGFLLFASTVLADVGYKMRHNPQTGRGDWVIDDSTLPTPDGTIYGWSRFPTDSTVYLTNIGDNVGIGSLHPQAKLDVDGWVYADGFSGDGSALTGITQDGTIYGWSRDAVDGEIYLTHSTDNVGIGDPNPATKLSVFGNVGINTTSPANVTIDAIAAGQGGLDAYAKLLLHMDGAEGGVTFTDSSLTPYTVTVYGNAQTTQVGTHLGTASMVSDGDGDFLSVPDSTDWSLGTSAFTIDTRIYFDNASPNNSLLGQLSVVTNQWAVQTFSTGKLGIYAYTGVYAVYITCPFIPTPGVWYHIAIVRIDNGNLATSWRMFINGVSQTLTLAGGSWNGTFQNVASRLDIAGLASSTFDGKMDEFRISPGVARWTSDFTPPSRPYDALSTNAVSNLIYKVNGVQGSKVYVDGDDSNKLKFDVPSTTRMTIDVNGNVGIGSSSPIRNLDVAGTANITGAVGLGTTTVTGKLTTTGNVGIGSTNPSQVLDVVGTGMFSGNVGIGSTTPRAALDVNGLIWGDGTNITGVVHTEADTLDTVVGRGATTTKAVTVGTANVSDNLIVTGNIGIGTASPVNKLGVVGNAHVSGNMGIGSINPAHKLDLNGDALISGAVGIGTYNDPTNTDVTINRLDGRFDKVWARTLAYTDQTQNSGTTKNFGKTTYTILATNAVNTTLYLGKLTTFSAITFNLNVKAVGLTLETKYWNGSAWTTLTCTDGTSNMTQSGTITFTPPGDWTPVIVSSGVAYYYIQFHSSTASDPDATVFSIAPSDNEVFRINGNLFDSQSGSTGINPPFIIDKYGMPQIGLMSGKLGTELSVESRGIDISTTSPDGVVIIADSNSSTAIPTRVSPRLRQTARAWDINSSFDTQIDFIQWVSGDSSNDPTGDWHMGYRSHRFETVEDAITEVLGVDHLGKLTVLGGISTPTQQIDAQQFRSSFSGSGMSGFWGYSNSSLTFDSRTDNAPYHEFYDSYTGNGFFWQMYQNKFFLIAGADTALNHFVMDGTGNIGLGTSAPAAKLDVRGGVNVSGNVGIGTVAPTAPLHIQMDDIKETYSVGLMLKNAGTVSSPPTQYSPALDFFGRAYTGTGVRTSEWQVLNKTIPFVGKITSELTFRHSMNGAGFLTLATIDADGTIYASDSFSTGDGVNTFIDINSDGTISLFSDTQSPKINLFGATSDFYLVLDHDDGELFKIIHSSDFSSNDFVMDTTGNIGLATSTPMAKLDVDGDIYARHNVGIGSASPRATLEVDGSIYNLKPNCDALCRVGGFIGCRDTGTCVAD